MRKFLSRILLPIIAGAPATPVDGETWYDSTAGVVRFRQNGSTDSIASLILAARASDIGKVFDFSGHKSDVPALHVLAAGQDLSRTTYALLYNVVAPRVRTVDGGSVSYTASTDVISTSQPHGFEVGDAMFWETGSTADFGFGLLGETVYYVKTAPSTTTFTLSTTRTVDPITGLVTFGATANITFDGGTSLPFTGGAGPFYQSGGMRRCPHGIGSITTFKAPDYRGADGIGLDNMGGTDSGRLGWANVLGMAAGSESHALTASQTPLRAHTHSGTTSTESVDHSHTGTSGNDNIDHTHGTTTGTESADHAHAPGGSGNFVTSTGGTTIPRGTSTAFATPNNLVYVTATAGRNAAHSHTGTSGGRSAFHQHATTTGGVSANHTHTMTTGNPSVAEANGAVHNSVQPGLLVNKIIYAGA